MNVSYEHKTIINPPLLLQIENVCDNFHCILENSISPLGIAWSLPIYLFVHFYTLNKNKEIVEVVKRNMKKKFDQQIKCRFLPKNKVFETKNT